MLLLIIASIIVLIVKQNKEAIYLFAMCISLEIMLTGNLIYIAKKGGISWEIQRFLFFTIEIKTKIQYLLITLNELGYIIAVGRYLFPMFLLLLALHYSVIPWIRRNYWIKRIAVFLPVFSLIIYYPSIFRLLTKSNPELQQVLITFSLIWILTFISFSVFLLLYEAYSINLKVFQRKFFNITTLLLSLSLLYLLYFGQDPAQVYQFYTGNFVWGKGILYWKSVPTVTTYRIIILVNSVCAIVGFAGLLKYTQEIFGSSREGVIIKHKSDSISLGTSVFVHSIKNQVLANRVIYKRIDRLYNDETVSIDKLKGYTDELTKQNENILSRIEELYNAVKINILHLVPIRLNEVVEDSIERFNTKYHMERIEVKLKSNAIVLADKAQLSEAIYNLLLNAQEAVNAAERGEAGRVSVSCYNVRLYTVIEVVDNGIGIGKDELRKICEPFYSKKNSNYNWGMGLYSIRIIANEHFGNLKYVSKEGEGSTFYLLLPKFKE
jgi:anti-sigma regulatory factor (Ser/Thr protein kinase)